MLLDASFHHGIDDLVFCSRVVEPLLSFLREPFVPLLLGEFLSHRAFTRAERVRSAIRHPLRSLAEGRH